MGRNWYRQAYTDKYGKPYDMTIIYFVDSFLLSYAVFEDAFSHRRSD